MIQSARVPVQDPRQGLIPHWWMNWVNTSLSASAALRWVGTCVAGSYVEAPAEPTVAAAANVPCPLYGGSFGTAVSATRGAIVDGRRAKRHLKQARKGAGITQQVLAKRLGRPQSFVSKYENAERRLDVVKFLQVAQALGVDGWALLGDLRAVFGLQIRFKRDRTR